MIATLIHESMTGCYASIRRKAIHRLGDHFDCVCHPEIMTAFVHALNDSDESVREKAADEIGDQIRRNRVCIGPPVVKALQCALADCDRPVRRQAEEALRLAGYRIVDGACCQTATAQPHSIQESTSFPASDIESAPVDVPPEILPEESVHTSNSAKTARLKVLPVSSKLVSRLKPITEKLKGRRTFSPFSDAVPPPSPPEEPAGAVPEIPNETELQDSNRTGAVLDRLFGQ